MWPVAAQHSFIPSFKHVMPNSVRNTEDLLLHPLSFFYKTSLFRCVPTYQSFIFLNHQVCFLYHYPDPPCPCPVCASLSHRFGCSLQQSGKLSSRKLWQIMDCWVTLWQQSPRLFQSFLITDRGVCWALAYGLRYCIRKLEYWAVGLRLTTYMQYFRDIQLKALAPNVRMNLNKFAKVTHLSWF